MASCPPPPSNLSLPPVPTIDALGGQWKVPFPIFQAKAKFEVAGKSDSDLHYSVVVPVPGTLSSFAGAHPLRDKLLGKQIINPLAKAGFDAAVKRSKQLWRLFLDTPTAWRRPTSVQIGQTPTEFETVAQRPPDFASGGWKPVYGNRTRNMVSLVGAQWRTSIGVVRVTVMPKVTTLLGVVRSETAEAFTARGGYLLARDVLIGAAGARVPVETINPAWVPKHDDTIEKFQAYVLYDVNAARVTLVLAMRNPSKWDRVGDYAAAAASWTCGKITSDKVALAAAFAGTAVGSTGIGATAVAGWAAAAAVCGMAFPKCPGAVAPDGGLPPTPTAPTPAPPGTIAWFDQQLGQFRLAAPIGLGGLQPTHTETAVVTELPGGIERVGRFRWERATRPWYRRTYVIGTGIGLAVIGAGTAAARTLRNR